MLEKCFQNGIFSFRLNDNGSGPHLLSQVCAERGWKEYCQEGGDENWNLWWKSTGVTTVHPKSLYSWQFVNHIPKGAAICRKDNLVRYLRCMKSVYGSIYDFSPHGFNLPLEYTKFAAECNRFRIIPYGKSCRKYIENRTIWICKPVSKSQGKGIFLFKKIGDLSYDTNAIVQKYIESPLLIGGYKFDLRLYVCIPSYRPLTIYMYREGLARFGTDKFDLKDLTNPFRHLTNCSINKLGPNYTEMKDKVGEGCKWTLKHLRKYFFQTGIHDWLLWQKISNLVVLTVLSHATQVPEAANCFDFFGFDVLIDENLRPWLLEVNLNPSLSMDCDADNMVKKPMLHDMFDLLGLPIFNTGLCSFDIWFKSENDDLFQSDPNLCRSRGNSARKITSRNRFKQTRSPSVEKCMQSNKNSKWTSSKKPLNLSKQTIILDDKHMYNDEWRKARTKQWGNGKDWNFAKQNEGHWIRLWPIKSNTAFTKTINEPLRDVKQIVMEVSKYSKIARSLIKKYPMGSDDLLNQELRDGLNIMGEIWLPPF